MERADVNSGGYSELRSSESSTTDTPMILNRIGIGTMQSFANLRDCKIDAWKTNVRSRQRLPKDGGLHGQVCLHVVERDLNATTRSRAHCCHRISFVYLLRKYMVRYR